MALPRLMEGAVVGVEERTATFDSRPSRNFSREGRGGSGGGSREKERPLSYENDPCGVRREGRGGGDLGREGHSLGRLLLLMLSSSVR